MQNTNNQANPKDQCRVLEMVALGDVIAGRVSIESLVWDSGFTTAETAAIVELLIAKGYAEWADDAEAESVVLITDKGDLEFQCHFPFLDPR